MSHPILKTDVYTPGTAQVIRSSGKVPSVVYGHKLETKNITVDKQEFRRVYRKAGKATLVDLEVSGKTIPVLIHVVDTHPISGDPIHIDFHAVRMNEEVHAVVPVKFSGISDAVKLMGGVLTIQHEQIHIKCLPKHLISSVETSLEKLKTFHDTITVADIPFPKEVTLIDPPETVIASVNAPRVNSADEETETSSEGGETGEKVEKKA
ncbi:50S ribosomal protein L25 [Candidatus Peregrinibacteria bacterium]|nr:MAG: 50S ribosomal protein L25 [Candidatus Peregrinibacteria bacterium]